MDILNILKNSKDSLYLEDLDFLETELAMGEYEKNYIVECKEQITIRRNWLKSEKNTEIIKAFQKRNDVAPQKNAPNEPSVSLGAPLAGKTISFKEQFMDDVEYFRRQDDYKKAFTKYINDSVDIDAKFIEENFSFFNSVELTEIIRNKQLGDEFLEKYFDALDKKEIAKHQCFSESFFIKHYSQLDYKLVLKNEKNEWHDKTKRSKQLDVFLRLKGVKL